MSNYDNNLRGVLFKNNKRIKDTQPNMTGSCEIDGVEYWVSAWTKESQSGNKFMSLSFTAKESMENGNASGASKQSAPVVEEFEDDIPF